MVHRAAIIIVIELNCNSNFLISIKVLVAHSNATGIHELFELFFLFSFQRKYDRKKSALLLHAGDTIYEACKQESVRSFFRITDRFELQMLSILCVSVLFFKRQNGIVIFFASTGTWFSTFAHSFIHIFIHLLAGAVGRSFRCSSHELFFGYGIILCALRGFQLRIFNFSL